jgi:calcium-dependent protein kinase
LYEFSQTQELFYLIAEYCAGGELAKRLEIMKYFSESLAARIMKQVLSAVAYCHKLHIAHR